MRSADLVQPGAGLVCTGIAVSLGFDDSQALYVVLRKDTRRHRYRTLVAQGGALRYFDHMRLQRFAGAQSHTENEKIILLSHRNDYLHQ